ncbi:uncharacterized protein LOC124381157 [Silurus meridionalis]|uniref:uncharacterized protein LOC124381157 n=1 Tax=Silurus meridionalis TaxID=175797 RepID=UPI001EEC09BE|nr:uncharacterized protein LOC124381157 [Silurus meridionalis]
MDTASGELTRSMATRLNGTSPGVNTVWFRFIDNIPVIGTVKEAVESVFTLYEGNEAVVKEKKEVIKNSVGIQSTEGAAGAAATPEVSGLKNVTEVTKQHIKECPLKGSKGKLKSTPEKQKKNEKELVDTGEKKRLIESDYQPMEKVEQELCEDAGNAKRGAHVFNNNVLKFHHKVLQTFIQQYKIFNLQGYNKEEIEDFGSHTLSQETTMEIQRNMVVHFEPEDQYKNENASLYGRYHEDLTKAFLNVLGHINPEDVTEADKEHLNDEINKINRLEIYVDEDAKKKWIESGMNHKEKAKRQARFDVVKHQVATMYETDRGLGWSLEILGRVAPLFSQRQ